MEPHMYKMVFQILYIAILTFGMASTEIDVFRLIQYKQGDNHFGSQSAAINFPASYYAGIREMRKSQILTPSLGDIFRKVAVIHLRDLLETSITSLLQRGPLGLVILLPDVTHTRPLSFEENEIWQELQASLSNFNIS